MLSIKDRSMNNVILEARDLRKTFSRGEQTVEALRGLSLKIEKAQFISIMGPSGSGKSTLLHLLGGLDRPTEGSVLFQNQPIEKLSDNDLSKFRRQKLGFIFQFFNLLPTLSALENVMLPCLLDGQSNTKIMPRATELLELVGLKDRMTHRPSQLSGGEMQRVAIARALMADPLLILADEPTGNLDSKTGTTVLELMRELVRTKGYTIVMVTHDPKAASFGTRLVKLRDGHLESDTEVTQTASPSL